MGRLARGGSDQRHSNMHLLALADLDFLPCVRIISNRWVVENGFNRRAIHIAQDEVHG